MTRLAESFTDANSLPFAISRGVSKTAETLRALSVEIEERKLNTGFAGVTLQRTLNALRELRDSHSQANWGGENELPISDESIAASEKFLTLLPAEFQLPDVIPEPSGNISFEWRYAPFRSAIVSFSGEQRIEYSSVLSRTDAQFGYCTFHGLVPLEVFRQMRRVSGPNGVP
jgi:hypothetical protein